MKWLTSVLAIYLLGLSLWPCVDDTLPLAAEFKNATLLTASTTHTESAHHHDHCSPLCSCTCCAITTDGIILLSYICSPDVTFGPISIATFQYTLPKRPNLLSAIWQPPQLLS